jgi:hypothetical protein
LLRHDLAIRRDPPIKRLSKNVVSAILDDVEPGFQPGGKCAAAKSIPTKPDLFQSSSTESGRQDAALYGRQDACRHNSQTSSTRRFIVRSNSELFSNAQPS